MSSSDFQSLLNSLNETARRVTEVLKPHIESLMTDTIKAIKPFTERIRRVLLEHDLNIKTGWWYPNYIVDELPAETIYNALKHEAETKAFTKLVVRECKRNDSELLRKMTERWQGYSFLPIKRKKILTDIISAHLNKQFTLSIPVAMSQVDYLHHAIFPKKGELPIEYKTTETIMTGQQINFARHFGLDNYQSVPASVFFELYPVYHYFKNVLYPSEKLREFQKLHDPELYKLSNPNNRGAILHGDNANYSSEARSLKQILLIDKLLYIMNKLKTKK